MSDNYGVQIERLAAQFEESKRVNEDLRASTAALNAENEALKDRVRVQNLAGINPYKITMREYDALQAKLSLYTAWTPQDPGTKEAMKIAWRDETSTVLADALRAAMVRLEEAEKESKGLRERLAQNHDWYCPCGHWNGANLDQCAACARHPGEQR